MMSITSGLFSMLGWGIGDFLAAKASRKIGFILTFFIAQIFGFLIILIYFFVNFQTLNIANIPKFFIILSIIGLLSTIATLAYYKGLKEGQVSLVSPIGASWAIITVILSMIFLKEILQKNQIIAILLVILGIILVSINIRELLKIKKINLFIGVKEGLIAMFGWGICFFLLTPMVKVLGWFLPTFLSKLISILFLTFYIFTSKQSLKINFPNPILIWIFLIGLLDVVAFFAYSFGVIREYASIIAPIAASYPLVTVLLARIFLKEKFVLNQIIGIISIIFGLILISI